MKKKTKGKFSENTYITGESKKRTQQRRPKRRGEKMEGRGRRS